VVFGRTPLTDVGEEPVLRLRTFCCAVVIASVVAPGLAALPQPAAASLGDKIQSQQSRIEATRKRLEDRRARLQFETVRASDLRQQLAQTDAGITRVTATLDVIETRIHHNEGNLAWNHVQLDAAEAALRRHDDALRRRLVDTYERGDLGYINVLLSATSFTEFVERWDDIGYLIAANVRTVRARRAAEQAVQTARAALERRELELAGSQREAQQTRYQLAALADQRTALVAAADVQRRTVANEVAQLEDLTAAQEAQLEAMIRERQREEEARRAAEEAARRRAAQLAGQQAPPPVNEGAPGTFSWPASGPITSPFGMRNDPNGRGFRMHTGIDIGAPMGATITASAGGRVIYAGWEGGYGNTIIIDHGGQTSTLYGHCSQIFVAEGQDVQRGQAIGAVGATGDATGPHLHFEIRINGVPIDPSSRL
jgi:septal ring factor EnvC (AmiA/AmiB activator)